MNLADTTTLITGGARGIGAATARAVVADGGRVMITDIIAAEGEALAAELGERASFQPLDVTDADQWAAAVAAARDRFGPVSVLVNNAGVVDFGPIEEQSPEAFRRVLDINLTGVWLGMRAALPSMRAAGDGCVVNVSSTAGLLGYANLGAYVASKWAVRGLTKTAALEFARDRVRVCSVHPGPIRTPMTAGMGDEIVAGQPIPRFGDPEEVARMIHFVVTGATFTTGAEFVVDGGAVTGVTPEVHVPE